MLKIRKIVRCENKGDYAKVVVLLEDGDEEYVIYVGGEVTAYHHNGQNRAFVLPKNQINA